RGFGTIIFHKTVVLNNLLIINPLTFVLTFLGFILPKFPFIRIIAKLSFPYLPLSFSPNLLLSNILLTSPSFDDNTVDYPCIVFVLFGDFFNGVYFLPFINPTHNLVIYLPPEIVHFFNLVILLTI